MGLKTLAAVGAAAALAGGLLIAAPSSATDSGNNGCTPGYWKQSQHFDSWQEYAPGDVLSRNLRSNPNNPNGPAYFALGANAAFAAHANDTFLQALGYKGGSTLDGAFQILMRATVAAFLNAANEFDPNVTGDGYPYARFANPGNILDQVNAALASGDRATMLSVATWLDDANNLGCPLS